MSVRTLAGRYWKVFCLILGCWTFLALLFTPQTYLANLRSPLPLTWAGALIATLILFYVWAALTPSSCFENSNQSLLNVGKLLAMRMEPFG